MNKQKYQQGAAGAFVIIAVVLVAVTLGVLYGARQFMMRQAVPPISTNEVAGRPTALAPQQQTAPDNAAANKDAKDSKETKDAPASTTGQTPTTSVARGTTDGQGTAESGSATEQSPVATAPSTVSHLPQTGPATAWQSALAVTALAASLVAYLYSRRAA